MPVTPPLQPQATPSKIKPKIGRNVLTCYTLLILVFILGLALLAFIITKFGFVSIPLFNRLYTGPQPARLVATQPLDVEEFRVMVSARCFDQYLAGNTSPVIDVNEKELTGALQSAIEFSLRSQDWKQEFSQIVVQKDYLELYGRFTRGPIYLHTLLRFRPELEGDSVKFVPIYVQLGDVKLSPELAYQALGYIFSRDLGAWRLGFGTAVLQKVGLKDGALVLTLSQTQN